MSQNASQVNSSRLSLEEQKGLELQLGFHITEPTCDQVDLMTQQLGRIRELRESLRRGFEESWEKANDLDKYRNCCDVRYATLKGRKAVRIMPSLFKKKARFDNKVKISRKIILYAQAHAMYSDFEVSIFEMCKVAYQTKAIVYAIDYSCPSDPTNNPGA